MEPIAVEAHYDDLGTLRPIAFIWQGDLLHVESPGRQWVAEGCRRFLVQVSGQGVFDLAYHLSDLRWYLVRKPSDFGPRQRSI